MSTDEFKNDAPSSETANTQSQDPPTAPAAMAASNKKRPRLDLTVGLAERKRGKSMFGVLVGTLNKAKAEDKERNASEAAKKRKMIDQRLQSKLRQETDSVRRAEEAKKGKVSANRKEEDLQLKDSIYKLRRTRLPQLSHFLITSDVIRDDDMDIASSNPSAALPPRSHPPPLYYLPAILTPSQERFLSKRKAQVKEAAEKEWESFAAERKTGVEDITALRQKVVEEEERKRLEREANQDEKEKAADAPTPAGAEKVDDEPEEARDAGMDIDDEGKDDRDAEPEKKEDRMEGDDDDAVEY